MNQLPRDRDDPVEPYAFVVHTLVRDGPIAAATSRHAIVSNACPMQQAGLSPRLRRSTQLTGEVGILARDHSRGGDRGHEVFVALAGAHVFAGDGQGALFELEELDEEDWTLVVQDLQMGTRWRHPLALVPILVRALSRSARRWETAQVMS